MVERGEIVKLWRSGRDNSGVLVSLVRVEGSSYRRPGARMYVQSGAFVGSISGGCLEGEIVRKATWLTRDGAAMQRYSTLFENPFNPATPGQPEMDANTPLSINASEIPYGLGCGGVIDVLLEPSSTSEAQALLDAFESAQTGRNFLCATVLPTTQRGSLTRLIWDESGEPTFASAELDPQSIAGLKALAHEVKSPEIVSFSIGSEDRDIFLESIEPPQRLVIFGAGEDARPLARMARLLGWRVTVADGRAWMAQPTRFPETEQIVALDTTRNLDSLRLTNRDAVAVLTHSFEQDRDLMPQLLPLELRYLGLLGPRHRSQLLLTQVADRLGWSFEECLRRVHTPVGLNLGGDSPEAIALAIVAEIQSVLHGRDLELRPADSQTLQHSTEETRYVPVRCPLDDPPESVDTAPYAH